MGMSKYRNVWVFAESVNMGILSSDRSGEPKIHTATVSDSMIQELDSVE